MSPNRLSLVCSVHVPCETLLKVENGCLFGYGRHSQDFQMLGADKQPPLLSEGENPENKSERAHNSQALRYTDSDAARFWIDGLASLRDRPFEIGLPTMYPRTIPKRIVNLIEQFPAV